MQTCDGADAHISIRAPARGATGRHGFQSLSLLISIRAPARGATPNAFACVCASLFQSALPRGERPYSHGSGVAPQYFNPRSREGSDDIADKIIKIDKDFNPRSREGSDIQLQFQHFIKQNFNPRSREGSDLYLVCLNLFS